MRDLLYQTTVAPALLVAFLFSFGKPLNAHAETAAVVGVSEKVIKIGSSKNMNPADDARPAGLARGEKLYFDKLNKSGGVNGRTIEYVEYDDAAEPKKFVDNLKKMIEVDKVFLLFSPYGTQNLKAGATVFTSAGLPVFAPAASIGVLTADQQSQVFAVKGTYIEEAEAMVTFAVEKKHWKRFAVLAQDDALGSEGRGGLVKALHDRQLTPVVTKSFSKNAAEVDEKWLPDFAALGAQTILLISNEKAGLKLLEALGSKKVKVPIFGASPLIANAFIKKLDELGSEAYLFQGYPLSTQPEIPIVGEYLKDAAKANMKPNNIELVGYINAAMLAEVLRLTGASPTRALFKEVIEKQMTDFNFKGVRVSFGPNQHSGIHQIRTYQLKGGSLVAQP